MGMKDFPHLTGPEVPPAAGGRAESLIVLLHGVGADGRDLIDLAGPWGAMLPNAAFIAPDAPFPCDMAPYGRQWFSLQDWTMTSLLAGVQAAAPILTGFLDRELKKRGLPWSRLALVGFSQGTMTALHAALRLPQAPAAVLGYSGALVGAELLAGDVRCRPPVMLIHGDADEVVPWQATSMAAQALSAAGLTVASHIRSRLGHGLDEEGIRLGGMFLRDSLRSNSTASR